MSVTSPTASLGATKGAKACRQGHVFISEDKRFRHKFTGAGNVKPLPQDDEQPRAWIVSISGHSPQRQLDLGRQPGERCKHKMKRNQNKEPNESGTGIGEISRGQSILTADKDKG